MPSAARSQLGLVVYYLTAETIRCVYFIFRADVRGACSPYLAFSSHRVVGWLDGHLQNDMLPNATSYQTFQITASKWQQVLVQREEKVELKPQLCPLLYDLD